MKAIQRFSWAVLTASWSSAGLAGDRGDWFKSLTVPGTKALCCDIADCHQTDAEWRKDQWWAVVDNTWRPMPPSKVLASPPSIDGSAYVCTGAPSWTVGQVSPMQSLIYCFVPPNLPM